jgi:enolase
MALDSRGIPTVKAIVASKKASGKAICPSGKSTGRFEATELRDKSKSFSGKGVEKAINNINNKISKALKGIDVRNQALIDRKMLSLDGTKNKSRLGANAILPVSLASAACAANALNIELFDYLSRLSKTKKLLLPVPVMNVINGGLHAGTELKIQEFHFIPLGAKTFSEAIRINVEAYHELKKLIEIGFGKKATNVGDEGGFALPLDHTEDALDLMVNAIEELGYEKKILLGIDAAATSLFNKKTETYSFDGEGFPAGEMIHYWQNLCKKYPIISIEDPFQEQDFKSFADLSKLIGGKARIVSDDLTVTNPERIKKAISLNACNALLVKPNQIGSLTETIEAVSLARKNNLGIIISHRSGDSEDTFVSDLSVALNAEGIKAGAPCRSERTSKYNRLLEIESLLGKKAGFIGSRFLA